MKRTIVVTTSIIVFLLIPLATFATPTTTTMRADKEDGAPLEDVVYVVRKALEQAESVDPPCPRTRDVKCFPPLKSIKLELNTVVGKTAGATISFLVFTIGHTRSKETSSTLSIELSKPKTAVRLLSLDDNSETLARAILNAKKSFAAAADIDPQLTSQTVTLVFKFVVSSETKGGLKVTDIIPVGLEGSGKVTVQQVHTITLVFGR